MVERAHTPDERLAMGDALPALGETTVDIYLNARTGTVAPAGSGRQDHEDARRAA